MSLLRLPLELRELIYDECLYPEVEHRCGLTGTKTIVSFEMRTSLLSTSRAVHAEVCQHWRRVATIDIRPLRDCPPKMMWPVKLPATILKNIGSLRVRLTATTRSKLASEFEIISSMIKSMSYLREVDIVVDGIRSISVFMDQTSSTFPDGDPRSCYPSTYDRWERAVKFCFTLDRIVSPFCAVRLILLVPMNHSRQIIEQPRRYDAYRQGFRPATILVPGFSTAGADEEIGLPTGDARYRICNDRKHSAVEKQQTFV